MNLFMHLFLDLFMDLYATLKAACSIVSSFLLCLCSSPLWHLRGKDLLVKASTVASEDSLCRGITDLPSHENAREPFKSST